jgi:hypothetical protein
MRRVPSSSPWPWPSCSPAPPTFGAALTTGGFSNNAGVVNELAVGAPDEDVGTARDAGAVTVLRGLDLNGVPSSSQQFTQGRVAGGQPELFDNFGAALG